MRALITGATGFVARHLVNHLISQGDEALLTSSNKNLPSADNLVHWDFSQPLTSESMEQIIQFAPQVIYHLAAISLPAACGNYQPNEQAVQINVQGTQAVLELAKACKEPPKIIFSSSAKVYALPDQSPTANHLVSESAAIAPASGYGKTKLAAEKLLLEQTEVPFTIVRAFNQTGPGQSPNYIVPQWCQLLLQNPEQIEVRSLHTSFDLSDVRDVVRGYRLLALHDKSGEIYNLGSGSAVKTQIILDTLLDILEIQPAVIEQQPRARYEGIADLSKLHSVIEFSQEFTFRETLLDVWKSMRQAAK